MADEDLKVRVLAAVAGANAEARRVYLAANPLRGIIEAAGFRESYARLMKVTDSTRYDYAALRVIAEYARQEVSVRVGLEIDEISEAGLARAIGKRAGFRLTSLSDPDVIRAELMAAAVIIVCMRMDWAIEEAVNTAEKFVNMLERKAAKEIEARVPGLELRDLLDVETTRQDVSRYVAKKIREKTGVPLRDPTDIEKTKRDILDWADAECRRRLGIKGTGGGLKMTARAIRNRRAQRNFYAAHGNLKVYQPV